MREIKFRAWDKENKQMYSWDEFSDQICWEISGEAMLGSGDIVIMQYTGLKDKNGKEIYEGDILTEGHGYNFEMVWTSGSTEPFSLSYYSDPEEYEVIGNIYENPELLP